MAVASVRAREVLAGLTTFFTMSYIVIVNPLILSSPGTGMSFSGVLTATVLVSALCTILMGAFARLPYAVAPGMGLNAFFAFHLVLGQQVPWPVALGIVVWTGVLFLVLSLTPLRDAVALAIPVHLRHAAAVGIGVFLTFIGLKNAGVVVSDPVTFVRLGHLGKESALAAAGLLVSFALMRRQSPFAFLAGIAAVTAGAWGFGLVKVPERFVAPPDFSSVFGKFDLTGAFHLAYLPAVISLLFTDLFDSLSTFMGIAQASGLVDERGQPLRLKRALTVDAIATFLAGVFGSSPGTAYVESAAGIEAGGRTGLTSIVTGLCFLPCLFLAPVVGMVPAFATAPVLVLVGALMFRSAAALKFGKMEDFLPSFLMIVLIPLTFSITQGLLWGFVAHVSLYALAGRRREISPAMMGVAVVSVLLILVENLHR